MRLGERSRRPRAVLGALVVLSALIGPAPVVAADVLTTTTLEFGAFLPSGEVEVTIGVTPAPPSGRVGIRAADGTVVHETSFFDWADGVETYELTVPLGAAGPYRAFYGGTPGWGASESAPVAWTDTRRPTTVSLESTRTSGAPFDPYQLTIDVDDKPEGLLITGKVALWSRTGPTGNSVRRELEATPSGNGVHVSNWTIGTTPARTLWVEYTGSETLQPSRSENLVITSAKIPVTVTVELDRTSIDAGESVEATVRISPPPGNLPPNPVARLQLLSDADDARTLSVPIDPGTGEGTVVIAADGLEPEVWTAIAEFPTTISDHALRFAYDESDPVSFRREPVGPRHTLVGSPAPAYIGEPLTITVTLDPVPSGGTVQLLGGPQWDQITTDLGTKPVGGAAGASASFTVTATQGWLYRTVFSGSSGAPPSRSGRFEPELGREPNTSLSSIARWVFTSTPSFTWSSTVTAGTGPATSQCSIDGGPWFACASPFTTPPLADGEHTFAVRTIDGLGTVESTPASRTFTIDTAAPVITSVVANGGLPLNTTIVPLQVRATDVSLGRHGGFWQILLSNNGAVDGTGRLINPSGSFLTEASTGPVTLARTWNFTSAGTGGTSAEGLKTVFLQVADPFGQWSEIASVTFRYDATPPGLTVSLADGAAVVDDVNVRVSLCCIGADPSGIAEVAISNSDWTFDGRLVQARSFPAGSTFTWRIDDPTYGAPGPLEPGSIAGPLPVYVQWRDRAGNWSAVVSDSIMVQLPAPYPFHDVQQGDRFATDIAWAYHAGITVGCGEGFYCPDGLVTRGQMATFLARALKLPSTSVDYFADDDRNLHEGAINRLRAAGITAGCGAGFYCPDGLVTRGQMATFLARALKLPSTSVDYFTDDDRSLHEGSINRLRAAGITSGCGPGRFCPDGLVTRGQMAAFLHRADAR